MLSHGTVRSPWFDQLPAVQGGMILALIALLARQGGIDFDINPSQKSEMRTHWAEYVLEWDTTKAGK